MFFIIISQFKNKNWKHVMTKLIIIMKVVVQVEAFSVSNLEC